MLPPVTIALLPSSRISMTTPSRNVVPARAGAVAYFAVMRSISSMSSRDRRHPAARDIGRDLLRRGRAGDDARHHRPVQQPAEGEFEQAYARAPRRTRRGARPCPNSPRSDSARRYAASPPSACRPAAARRGGISRSAARWPAARTGSARARRIAAPASARRRARAPAGCSAPGRRQSARDRNASRSTAPRRPARPTASSSRCSAPCPAARDRRARAASPRSASADRRCAGSRGRYSRCRAACRLASTALHDVAARGALQPPLAGPSDGRIWSRARCRAACRPARGRDIPRRRRGRRRYPTCRKT